MCAALVSDFKVKIFQAPFDRYRGKFILKLMVPEHTCSIVIGPKGANTKKIREVRKIAIISFLASLFLEVLISHNWGDWGFHLAVRFLTAVISI